MRSAASTLQRPAIVANSRICHFYVFNGSEGCSPIYLEFGAGHQTKSNSLHTIAAQVEQITESECLEQIETRTCYEKPKALQESRENRCDKSKCSYSMQAATRYSFTMPTVEIGCAFPVVNSNQIWEDITTEYSEKRLLYQQYKYDQLPPDPPIPYHDLPANYLDKEVFPILLPALRQTLEEAKRWDCLQVQKCKFNGLDYIAELLWNRNPRYPKRIAKYTEIFNIPFAKAYLEKHPRPIYPLSWLWTPEEAALRIQRFVRGFLVRKDPEVQEMRQFWKVYNAEKEEARQQKIKAMKAESMMQAKLRIDELTTKLEKTINQLEINKLISRVVNNAIGLSESEYWSGIVEAYELQMEEENEQAAGEYKFHRIESDEV